MCALMFAALVTKSIDAGSSYTLKKKNKIIGIKKFALKGKRDSSSHLSCHSENALFSCYNTCFF